MDFLNDLKEKIAAELKVPARSFSYPPQAELGDLSLACFEVAKEQHKAPGQLAEELADAIKAWPEFSNYFSAVKAIGPYLNFFLSPGSLAAAVLKAIKQKKGGYGSSCQGKKKVMVEYSNANTHKEYHVGHLRNISYGDATSRLLEATGCQVVPVSYINDFGIHIAKTLWYWQKHPEYRDRPEPKGYLLGKCYASASQELEDDPGAKEAVSRIMKDIESLSGEHYRLWQETRQWSLDYFQQIYKELGVKFAHTFYESQEISHGWELTKQLVEKGIFTKSQGAIIADLEKYGLGVLPIIRSDGTALYPVADLALASEKFRRFTLDESIYVVDVRQGLYFKQLFKILDLMGYHQELVHLAYDFVTLPEGMMSSRTGKVVTYEELKEKISDKLIAETKSRHEDWTGNRIEMVAKSLAIATIKFELLKVSADKIITFNIEEALRFDGYTACYLQYGYARLKSILRKESCSWFKLAANPADLKDDKEKALVLKVAKYPETVRLAAATYNPSEIARYLFELVQLFNDYYHETNILKADAKLREARLSLIKAVAQVLKNGFGLLGLPILEEM